jgi:hypothetical protein
MKWAKTKKDLDDGNVPSNDRSKCFAEYHAIKVKPDPNNTQKKIAEGQDKDGNIIKTLFQWVTYDNLDKLKKKVQRKYEIFCGGFLGFYDDELIHYLGTELKGKVTVGAELIDYLTGKAADHEIFFEWGKDKKNADKIFVTIYLNPPAGNPDPPSPPAPPPPETST